MSHSNMHRKCLRKEKRTGIARYDVELSNNRQRLNSVVRTELDGTKQKHENKKTKTTEKNKQKQQTN